MFFVSRVMSQQNGKLNAENGRPYLWDADNPLGYANRVGRYRTKIEADFLLRQIGDFPQRVLDMGGGSGRLGGMLAARGHQVTLIDKDPEAITLARKNGIQHAVVCDLADFGEAGFDCAICMEVMEYFEDCDPIIAKADQFLKAGGTLIFCIINSKSWRFRLRGLKNDGYTPHAFDREEIERSLKRHGFEIAERRGFQWSLASTGSDSLLVDLSALIEKSLGLQKWLAQSPWLLYACKKTGPSEKV
jgi:SAM-dependent methyltransferase